MTDINSEFERKYKIAIENAAEKSEQIVLPLMEREIVSDADSRNKSGIKSPEKGRKVLDNMLNIKVIIKNVIFIG